ncbi:hypothetical protein VNI00_010816 [Paramarasmius palmivorus]|uniref:Uncharacterized protein n=1 Tax=Paramarasmius palmivorus TaxID=297713 RepID=A0AAW0CCG5_9AGAR
MTQKKSQNVAPNTEPDSDRVGACASTEQARPPVPDLVGPTTSTDSDHPPAQGHGSSNAIPASTEQPNSTTNAKENPTAAAEVAADTECSTEETPPPNSQPVSQLPPNSRKWKSSIQTDLELYVDSKSDEDIPDTDSVVSSLVAQTSKEKTFLGHPKVLANLEWREVANNKHVLATAGTDTPVSFWTIGEIDSNQYWLFSDGSWNPKILSPFVNHAATACLKIPVDTRLHKPFHDSIQGAQRIAQFHKENGVIWKIYKLMYLVK